MGFRCSCDAGYTGPTCNTDCSRHPCGRNGVCKNGVTGFTCACYTGYTGSRCQTDCSSSSCSGHGVCNNTPTSFTCACYTGYTGSRCQAVKTTTAAPTTTVTPSQTQLSSCRDDPRVKCSPSICSVGALNTYCPLTCKVCTPCSDSKLVNCKITAVCNDTTLKNYCKATCGLCSTRQNSSTKTTSWIHIKPTPTPTRWLHVGGK
ncbi:unnamed protein product [Mytilus edulis]|uniref:Uncharacterized protein n=1 Tax=Mytilus edulis TaxID=6550 RepID=A0A8S3QZT0_MYTED|nr:unnamed protein product [Mytilus edulis]